MENTKFKKIKAQEIDKCKKIIQKIQKNYMFQTQ